MATTTKNGRYHATITSKFIHFIDNAINRSQWALQLCAPPSVSVCVCVCLPCTTATVCGLLCVCLCVCGCVWQFFRSIFRAGAYFSCLHISFQFYFFPIHTAPTRSLCVCQCVCIYMHCKICHENQQKCTPSRAHTHTHSYTHWHTKCT